MPATSETRSASVTGMTDPCEPTPRSTSVGVTVSTRTGGGAISLGAVSSSGRDETRLTTTRAATARMATGRDHFSTEVSTDIDQPPPPAADPAGFA